MNLVIREIAHHRNGVSGEPFYVVNFHCEEQGNMIGVVFYGGLTWNSQGEYKIVLEENPRVAVFKRELLGEGVVAFGENSFRGDDYAQDLCFAINRHLKVESILEEIQNEEKIIA